MDEELRKEEGKRRNNLEGRTNEYKYMYRKLEMMGPIL